LLWIKDIAAAAIKLDQIRQSFVSRCVA